MKKEIKKFEFDKNDLFKNLKTIEDFEKAMKNDEFRKEYLKKMESEESPKKGELIR